MPAPLGGVLTYLRRLAPDGPAAEDGQLLSRFVQGDGGAFTAIVGRYAPLVWGVCRRLLGASPDAEDAFQATFVVLVQKASGLADGRPLGPWLYRVASRTATKARARSARRRDREVSADVEPVAREVGDAHRRELTAVLDEELGRLPERYRQPVVLCYLEGLTNEEAAQRLACPKGTILSRLSRARERLRERLARRGIDLSAILLPAVLAPTAPPGLVAAVGEAGPLLRSGGAAGLSTTAMVLAKGVMFSMFLRKVEMVGLVVLALAIAASGAGWVSQRPVMSAAQAAPAAAEPQKAEEKPKAKEEKDKEVAKVAGVEELAAALTKPVDFPGTDGPDPRLPLGEVLDKLTQMYGVTFDINEKAFRYEAPGLEITKVPVAAKEGLPRMKDPLRRVLDKILSRVENVPTGVTFLIRKNHIEVTTGFFAGSETRVPSKPTELDEPVPVVVPTPLVWKRFRNESFSKALDDLSEAADVNIVLDPQVEEKTKATVTARLMNVPVDTAVRVVAEMAGLSVVEMDNVFYVTTPVNAKKLVTEKPLVRPGARHGTPAAVPPGGM